MPLKYPEAIEKKLAAERVVRAELPKGVVWAKPLGPGKHPKIEKPLREPIEHLASQFVNLPVRGKSPTEMEKVSPQLRDWYNQHRAQLPVGPKRLAWLALELRLGWKRTERAEYLGRVVERILSATNAKPMEALDRVPVGNRRPAFQVQPGHSNPVFVPRDLLDEIAYAVWQGSERGLLKVCKGQGCKTPLFIANRQRRAYCYSGCGDGAKRRAKLAWWRKNRSPKRSRAA